jgi:hypothetical protein
MFPLKICKMRNGMHSCTAVQLDGCLPLRSTRQRKQRHTRHEALCTGLCIFSSTRLYRFISCHFDFHVISTFMSFRPESLSFSRVRRRIMRCSASLKRALSKSSAAPCSLQTLLLINFQWLSRRFASPPSPGSEIEISVDGLRAYLEHNSIRWKSRKAAPFS